MMLDSQQEVDAQLLTGQISEAFGALVRIGKKIKSGRLSQKELTSEGEVAVALLSMLGANCQDFTRERQRGVLKVGYAHFDELRRQLDKDVAYILKDWLSYMDAALEGRKVPKLSHVKNFRPAVKSQRTRGTVERDEAQRLRKQLQQQQQQYQEQQRRSEARERCVRKQVEQQKQAERQAEKHQRDAEMQKQHALWTAEMQKRDAADSKRAREQQQSEQKRRQESMRMKQELDTVKQSMRTQEESMRTQREETARKTGEQFAKLQAEQKRAKAELHREREEARERQRVQELRFLKDSKKELAAQRTEKRADLDKAREQAGTLAAEVATEEKAIAEFRVERLDKATKIVILLGKTGAGKSTFSNRLSGDKSKFGDQGPCKTSGRGKSETQTHTKQLVSLGDDSGVQIAIVDTPGYADSAGRRRDRRHSDMLCAYLQGCGGINAFVLVHNGAETRICGNFQKMVKEYEAMFGMDFWSRLIIVATRVEGLTKEQFDADVLAQDIRDALELDVELPIIPIGSQDYAASIANFAKQIPSERHQFKSIVSPIDELKQQHAVAEDKANTIARKVAEIEAKIANVDCQIKGLGGCATAGEEVTTKDATAQPGAEAHRLRARRRRQKRKAHSRFSNRFDRGATKAVPCLLLTRVVSLV